MITGGQIRAARGFLRWSAEDLAARADIGVQTVRRAERADGTPNMLANKMEAIKQALEASGIEFLEGEAPGVRWRGNAKMRIAAKRTPRLTRA